MGLRRQARELALKALYEIEFNQADDIRQLADRLTQQNDSATDVAQFMSSLLELYQEHKAQIDKTIESYSSNWKLPRMATVDRNILRLGVLEICFIPDIPKSVTINEYLEIAKKYGTEESRSFVNGVLDKVPEK